MTEQSEAAQDAEQFRTRYCVHYRAQQPGTFYSGALYVAALQKLKANAAMHAASKVEAFFWKDAPVIQVWLCLDCAVELALLVTPAAA